MRRLVLVLSFFLFSTSFQFTPSNGTQIKKPNLYFEWEKFDGGFLYFRVKDSLREDLNTKSFSYECFSSSGTCTIDWWADENQTILANVFVQGYTQGSLTKVTVRRTVNYYIDGLFSSVSQESSLSTQTFNPLPRPIRGDITSEPNGCSFQILNFDNRNEYYFKAPRWDISKSGRVRLYLFEGTSSIFSYVSVTRKGYVTINAVETEHECKSSS